MNSENSLNTPRFAMLNGARSNSRTTIRFLPILLLYIFIVIMASTNTFQGDEGRYIMYASNLSNGHYSPEGEIFLWNGPGYPIVLLPFVIFDLPWLAAKLLNSLFLFIAVIYFYYTLRFYMQERPALFFSYLLGLYLPFCRYLPFLLTEEFSIFLICGFMFHFCKLNREDTNTWIQLLISSVYLGYLALTKIFFGYLILSGLILFMSLYLWQKRNVFKKTFLVYMLAFFCCAPYLFYTYTLTDKILYWGDSGGMSLYWMSTPYENEYGDWQGEKGMHRSPQILNNHRAFYREISKHSGILRDEAFKRKAIQNIVDNPIKYFKNWLANIGRLLFNYPYSYESQKLSTYFYFLPNMFLVVISVLCIYPSYMRRKFIPDEIYVLLISGLISFGGSSLLSAYNRQFMPLVPIFALWIAFILTRIVKVEIRQ